MICRDEGRPVVFRAVDQFGGKPGQHLPVGQFDRLGAERPDHRGHLLGLLHPDPQSLEVRHRGDRAHAVVDRAGAGIVKRQADESIRLETAQDFVADREHNDVSMQQQQHGHVLLIRDIKEQEVFFGEIPLMTQNGTFIINGTERVIVTQLHRSPGVFFETPNNDDFLRKSFLIAVSWVEFESDGRTLLYVRIDRKRKFLRYDLPSRARLAYG